MRTRFLTPDSLEWRALLLEATHDVYHLPQYVAAAAAHEGGRPCAYLAECGDKRLLVPLILRSIAGSDGCGGGRFDAISPYGYGGPVLTRSAQETTAFLDEVVPALLIDMRDYGIVSAFLRLHPVLPVPIERLRGFGCIVYSGDTVSIDLKLSNEEMWRQTRANHRRDILKGSKSGHSVRMDHEFTSLSCFREIYLETMCRVGAEDYYLFSREYFDCLRRALGAHLHLCLVEIEGEVACAGLFTEVCGIVQYHLGGTRDRFLPEQPSKSMFNYIRLWARERGNRVLHLGGGVGGRADALFHFKAGFSPLRTPFYTWRAIVDERAYRRLVTEWETCYGVSADGPEGFFPAYRKLAGAPQVQCAVPGASNPVMSKGEADD